MSDEPQDERAAAAMNARAAIPMLGDRPTDQIFYAGFDAGCEYSATRERELESEELGIEAEPAPVPSLPPWKTIDLADYEDGGGQ